MAAKKTSGSKASTSTRRKTSTANSTAARKTQPKKTTTSARNNGAKSSQAVEPIYKNPLVRDIAILVFFALSLMILASNFGYGGEVGGKLADNLFGCFGIIQFILPLLLVALLVFVIANKNNRYIFRKVVGWLGFIWFMMAFLGLVTDGLHTDTRLIDYFRDSRYNHLGSGLMGGILLEWFGKFGLICTWIFVLMGLLIFLILATQKPLLSAFINLDGPEMFGGKFSRSVRSIFASVASAFGGAFAAISGAFHSIHLPKLPKVFQDEEEDGDESYDDDYYDEIDDEEDGDELDEESADADGPDDAGSNRKKEKSFVVFPSFHKSGKSSKTNSGKSESQNSEDEDAYDHIEFPMDFDESYEEESENVTSEDLSRKPLVIDHFDDQDMDEVPEDSLGEDSGFDEEDAEYEDADSWDEEDEEDEFPWLDDQGYEKKNDKSRNLTSPPERMDAEGISGKTRRKRIYLNSEELEAETREVEEKSKEQSQSASVKKQKPYQLPPLNYLEKGRNRRKNDNSSEIQETVERLQETFDSFGVNVNVLEDEVSCGPTVTQFQIKPGPGVKVSRIVSLADDIKLALGTADIRFEAPIPGKNVVGIEVPNESNQAVYLRDLLETEEFKTMKSKLAFGLGMNISGKPEIVDIAKMPHLLIAGATGSGKSVCINTLIMSLLYKADPSEVKLIMIDPKVVELSVYNGIPHLLIPVVTDPKKASGALNWAVQEMTRRYNAFAEYHVRDMKSYNTKVKEIPADASGFKPEVFPQIVIIVDELADLMMVAPGEVEESICRLAQLARAAGIHLIIATQRPSVNVITGLIKANMPTRIAFSVSSGVDSRTILDMVGAEKLLGKGDMLYKPQNLQKPVRLQGSFVSDDEVESVVQFLKEQNQRVIPLGNERDIEKEVAQASLSTGVKASELGENDRDQLFADAGRFIIEKDKASIGMMQRVFKIGFNRAARIMDQLADAGVVGPEEGTKPRKILMSLEQFENYLSDQF